MLKGLFSSVKKKITEVLGTSSEKNRDISPVKYTNQTRTVTRHTEKKPYKHSDSPQPDSRQSATRPARTEQQRDTGERKRDFHKGTNRNQQSDSDAQNRPERKRPQTNRPHRDENAGKERQPKQVFAKKEETGIEVRPSGRPNRQPYRERPVKKEVVEQKKERPVKNQILTKPEVIETPALPTEPWDASVYSIEPQEGKSRFHDFPIPEEIMHAIYDLNYQYCTPIQAGVLSATLAGKDATGQAQTGTGKTAAFLITIFSRLLQSPIDLSKRRYGTPRALIIAPTRELVMQIAEDAKNLSKYSKLKILSVYGGMDFRKQKNLLNTRHVDVVVATPGRLLDFHTKHDIHLSRVEILVIDEADRMLDMGFIPDVRNIVRRTPRRENRQTLFFSATLNEVVRRLASQWTKESFDVEIEPEQVEVTSVSQLVYIVTNEEKPKVLFNLLDSKKLERVIIFANRRDEVKSLFDILQAKNISSSHLSGDIDQKQRIRTLDEFKAGNIRVLIATDVASRGIHIDGVSHVINYTLPEDAEDYVHRIGRTGRAGASGISISFASEDDSFQIPAIEEYLGHKLECVYPDDDLLK